MRACCVIAGNYLAHARVLAETFAAHHPGRLTVLPVDDPGEEIGAGEPFDVARPEAVGIERVELHRRALIYDLQGLISSLRPLLVRTELDRRQGPVLLLDADMEVLGPLDDVAELAGEHGVVLSPHTTAPLGGAPGRWREEGLLRCGTFNGGFVGVGERGRPFADFMAERTARDCVDDPARGLFYSQTWLDLVPALFDHAILRDRGVNAMAHNLQGDDVDWDDGGARIGAAPLRLFHYTGFDAARPGELSRYGVEGWPSLADRPGLARLCARYAERIEAAGLRAARERESPWVRLPEGVAVDRWIRRAYRAALLAGDEPPDPFAGPGLVDWLREPAAGSPLTRYLQTVYAAREDLRAVFPRIPGRDEARLHDWARSKAAGDGSEVQAELAVSAAPGPRRRGLGRWARARGRAAG